MKSWGEKVGAAANCEGPFSFDKGKGFVFLSNKETIRVLYRGVENMAYNF